MCFSASASFVAGTALSATGVITTSKIKSKKELPFAAIPLFFGIQQLLDGVVWVTFGRPLINMIAGYGYSFFAYVLWPALMPFAVFQLEQNEARKKVLRLFMLIGGLTSLYSIYLLSIGPLSIVQLNSCIRYDTIVQYWPPMTALYLLATCGSCLVSSEKFVRLFGLVVLISAVTAAWFYLSLFASIWCFFAAVLSGMIYWRFRN